MIAVSVNSSQEQLNRDLAFLNRTPARAEPISRWTTACLLKPALPPINGYRQPFALCRFVAEMAQFPCISSQPE